MEQRDYYEVLGVPKDVDVATLKRSYRKLALQYHPDRNAEPQAAAEFKAATEAYGVLSDPEKRALYDIGGHAAVNGRGLGFDPSAFRDFGDLFSAFRDIFGGDGGGGPRGTRPQRGDDLLHDLRLTFEEAALGTEAALKLPRLEGCTACSSTGAAPGTTRKPCTDCGGRGQVVLRQGFFSVSHACGRCRGEGSVLQEPCTSCRGEGRIAVEKTLKVRVPGGISSGQRIRISREGESGLFGGPPGDLYVRIEVEEHDFFWREGFDLHLQLPVSFPQVALGANVDCPTLAGAIKVDIPAGTEGGEVIRVRGKGLPRLNASGLGDLLIHVRVRTPRRLNEKQAKLLRAYAESVNEQYDVKEEKTLLERVRDIFA